eukprot:CAMPEP_0118828772 /NCGR_PEP_ID=MMETSP1162-20130426/20396_1 /TAXON_ID=33656 /ORGANISM="Phaeocystis Sp, Strain CCMP2710" /LENGTH=213 /DNA_ID=CAMNT_0006759837 /DNA_START=180 /DNA_END=821 /DNA_ORIENTATION=+
MARQHLRDLGAISIRRGSAESSRAGGSTCGPSLTPLGAVQLSLEMNVAPGPAQTASATGGVGAVGVGGVSVSTVTVGGGGGALGGDGDDDGRGTRAKGVKGGGSGGYPASPAIPLRLLRRDDRSGGLVAQGSVVDKCLMHLFTLLRESRGAAALLPRMPTPRSAITNALATVQSSAAPTDKAQTVVPSPLDPDSWRPHCASTAAIAARTSPNW